MYLNDIITNISHQFYVNSRQSVLSLHMTKSYVRTATRSQILIFKAILKLEANLTQILHFKVNFHTEFEPFFKKKIYANNGGHFKIVSIKIKNKIKINIVHIKPYNLKK